MFHSILDKSDRALVAYLIALGAGAESDTFPAKRSANKALPCTICWSRSARPLPEAPHSGTQQVEAFIQVRSSGIQDDPAAPAAALLARNRLAAVADAFSASELQSGEPLGEAITCAAHAWADIDNFQQLLDFTGLATLAWDISHPDDADLLDYSILSAKVIEVSEGFDTDNPMQAASTWVD